MDNYIEVTKEQLDKFITNRFNKTGVKLDRDVTGICEPPLMTLNDLSIGLKWPNSVVAKGVMYDGSEYHHFKQPEYYIVKSELDKYGC